MLREIDALKRGLGETERRIEPLQFAPYPRCHGQRCAGHNVDQNCSYVITFMWPFLGERQCASIPSHPLPRNWWPHSGQDLGVPL